jgi:hypothetical protein
LTIRTSFSTPVNSTKLQRTSSLTNDASSPSLHFSPVFSPFPSLRTESTATTPKTASFSSKTTNNDKQSKPIYKSSGSIEYQLINSHSNLPNGTSRSIERKRSVLTDLNESDEDNDQEESKFRFPAANTTTIRRRSTSAKHDINRRKLK